MIKIQREFIPFIILYVLLTVLVTTSTIYAKNAEGHAADVSRSLNEINITAQNRCIITVVLSYPPPVGQEQFDTVLQDYDKCIIKETNVR